MTQNITFKDFPVEILHQIISYFSVVDTYAFQNTSKFLQYVTQPVLYKHLKWEFNKPDSPEQSEWERNRNLAPAEKTPPSLRPALHILLRRLIQQPELGSLIQCIDFMEKKTIHTIWKNQTPELTPGDLEQLADRGRSITRSQKENWLEELQIGNQCAFVTLLLSYCPNLKKLILLNDFIYTWTWDKNSSIAPNQSTLWEVIHSLNKIEEIDCDRYGMVIVPEERSRLNLVLRLPMITCLRLSIMDSDIFLKRWNDPIFIHKDGTLHRYWTNRRTFEVETELVDVKFPDPTTVPCSIHAIKAPKLKTLEILESFISEHAVRKLVATAPNLTSLTIEIARDPQAGHIFGWIHCDILREALVANLDENHPTSPLENLAIRCKWKGHSYSMITAQETGIAILDRYGNYAQRPLAIFNNDDLFGPKGTIGSLKHLTNLKRLEIAPQILLGWWPDIAPPLAEVIPDSLTHFTFRHDCCDWVKDYKGFNYGWFVKDFINLIRQYGSSVNKGNLRSVTFIYRSISDTNGYFPGPKFTNNERLEIRQACEFAGLEYTDVEEDPVQDQHNGDIDNFDYQKSSFGNGSCKYSYY